jgi:hypothetical protein
VISVAKSFRECRAALANREIPCPECEEPLRPRGFSYPREKLRGVPGGEADVRAQARPRGQCGPCRRSHVLVPAAVAAYRADALPVLVCTLLAHVLDGLNAGEVAMVLCRPARTVRGWLRQARVFAARHLPALTALLERVGGAPAVARIGGNGPVAELVTVLRALGQMAAERWGDAGLGEWERINLICRGRFISPSLSSSFYQRLVYPGTE